MKKKLGEKKIHEFRRSWNIKPDPLDKNNPYHPINIEAYKSISKENIPDSESLEDTYNRVIPYYKSNIENKLIENKNVLVVAHGNSIRSLCKYLFKLDEKKISLLEIPTGNPLIINFEKNNKIAECKYLDQSRAKDLIVF
jgi:2,3-bisphosphoglycerate-dependent phosphoglycerate mutase